MNMEMIENWTVLMAFFHLFYVYLLNTYNVWDTVIDPGHIGV